MRASILLTLLLISVQYSFSSNFPTTPPLPPMASGIYTVGTGGDFSTLTSAVAMYNSGPIDGPVTFRLINTLYNSSSESFPIKINANAGSGPSNTLTIVPAAGIAATITGGNDSISLIDLNGADYVIFDGLNTGGSSLTISNTMTGNHATIRFLSDATYNTITNCSILGSSSSALSSAGGNILFSKGNLTGNDHNTISGCMIGPAGSNLPSKGICSLGTATSVALCNSNNVVNNCEIYDFFLSSGCAGIYLGAGNTEWSITNNKFYETASRTFIASGIFYGIYFSDITNGSGVQITGNTVGYSGNTGTGTLTLLGNQAGAFAGIAIITSPTANSTTNVNSNIISDVSLTSTGGELYGIHNASGQTSNVININNNIIRNLTTLTTNGLQAGIYAGSAANLTVDGNLITNISRNGVNKLSGIEVRECQNAFITNNEISSLSTNISSGTSIIIGITDDVNSRNYTVSGNTIHDFLTTSSSEFTLMGITFAGRLWGGNKVCSGNEIYNFSSPSNGILIGLTFYSSSSPDPLEISNNKIHHFNGGFVLYAIEQNYNVNVNIFKNKIYDLSTTVTLPTINGIRLGGGNTSNIYNNLIGDLRATSANTGNPVSGIDVEAGSVNNIYYNTIYLNATSDGALFGSSGIYMATAPVTTLRNNLIINTSVPRGTGYTCALRRSGSQLSTYGSASNGNVFYSGTPGPNNLIMYNGNSYQYLSAYKNAVGPSRDSCSRTGNISWVSTTGSSLSFLHVDPSTPSYAESSALPITNYGSDYDADVRNLTTPDIGADEFNGIPVPVDLPLILYSPPTFTCGVEDLVVTDVTIADSYGVPVPPSALSPRIYYRKNSGSWFSGQGTLTTGSATNGKWSFTIVSSVLGTLQNLDVVSYYFVAQDMAAVPNIAANPPEEFEAVDVNTIITPPVIANTMIIHANMSGTYSVGTGGSFETLTQAALAVNSSCLNGPVTLELINDNYDASETFPVLFDNNPLGAEYPVTVKPASGKTVTITGNINNNAAIKILRSNFILDGSNAGTSSRNLTITNTAITNPYAVIIGSTGTNLITDVTCRNCILYTSNRDAGNALDISDGTTPLTDGYFDNITIQNNKILNASTGIGAYAVPGNGNGLLISGNEITGSETTCVNKGIFVSNVDECSITGNTIGNFAINTVLNPGGIFLDDQTRNSTISGNTISNLTYSGNHPVCGISAITSGTTNNLIQNNNISAIHSSSNSPVYGIFVQGDQYYLKNNIIKDIKNDNSTDRGGAFGIALNSMGTFLVNNQISDVASYGDNNLDGDRNGYGIFIISGLEIRLYHNSVNLATNQTDPTGYPVCLMIGSPWEMIFDLDMRNNIFSIPATSGTEKYAIATRSPVMMWNNTNYNNYYSSGANLAYSEGINLQNLAAWQSNTYLDLQSVSGDPKFTGPTDLHIIKTESTPVSNAGVSLGENYSLDMDNETRSDPPDIGADEFDPTLQWNGTVSSNWNNSLNWSPCAVPDASTNVNIMPGYIYEPNVNLSGLSCGNLMIGTGTIMHVPSGTKITITRNLAIESGATLDNKGEVIIKGNLETQ